MSEEHNQIIESSITKAFEAYAETQRLLSLPFLTSEQVAMVYPVSRSRLEKMRMNRSGPEFIQPDEKGGVSYTHKAVRDWLNRHRQRVM